MMNTASRVLRRISPRQVSLRQISLRGAGVTAAASGALAVTAALALAGPAGASTVASGGYQFRTVDNTRDVTFNQLLGVNNEGVIAGYFGSGAQNHPNKGYLLLPNGAYVSENFPHSVQTQVTGLNDRGVTVGFYTNGQGSNRGYLYNIGTRTFTRVLVPGAPAGQAGPSLTAAAINNHGDVAGFYAKTSSQTDAFLRLHNGRFLTLAVPGASATQALGVNDSDEVVGVYTVGSGNSAQLHGFTWRPGYGFRTVDDPHGIGTTIINGVNDAGELVGFYVDGAGNTDGMIAARGH